MGYQSTQPVQQLRTMTTRDEVGSAGATTSNRSRPMRTTCAHDCTRVRSTSGNGLNHKPQPAGMYRDQLTQNKCNARLTTEQSLWAPQTAELSGFPVECPQDSGFRQSHWLSSSDCQLLIFWPPDTLTTNRLTVPSAVHHAISCKPKHIHNNSLRRSYSRTTHVSHHLSHKGFLVIFFFLWRQFNTKCTKYMNNYFALGRGAKFCDQHEIGHFGDILPSQSLGLALKNYIKHNIWSKHASVTKYTTT